MSRKSAAARGEVEVLAPKPVGRWRRVTCTEGHSYYVGNRCPELRHCCVCHAHIREAQPMEVLT